MSFPICSNEISISYSSTPLARHPLFAAQRAAFVAGPKSPTHPAQQVWLIFNPHLPAQSSSFFSHLASHLEASVGHLS